ncbi:MAG: thioesterase [Chroococcidiopsidaceae cyanobacterium CP_BM_ER_R8_30]|nr:thioesterase [Chroococcidiopsidaceae cyanobacterium CP_BM_ER_R8_30]
MATTPIFKSWVTCPKPNSQAKLRLFCFPYVGASSLIFRTWSDSLPATIEVCPIKLPGRGTRFKEAPFNRLEPLVQAIACALKPHLDKPFAFFGHSMGGLVCFEVTRLLRRHGIIPLHLFISGRQAPQIPYLKQSIHTLPEPEFLLELCRLNGTPKAVLENAELMQLFLPVLRADFSVLETYVYAQEPPLECPITAFGGLQDPEVNCEELEAWRQQTSSYFSLKMFRGDHFFIHSAQTLLLQSLSQQLHMQFSEEHLAVCSRNHH